MAIPGVAFAGPASSVPLQLPEQTGRARRAAHDNPGQAVCRQQAQKKQPKHHFKARPAACQAMIWPLAVEPAVGEMPCLQAAPPAQCGAVVAPGEGLETLDGPNLHATGRVPEGGAMPRGSVLTDSEPGGITGVLLQCCRSMLRLELCTSSRTTRSMGVCPHATDTGAALQHKPYALAPPAIRSGHGKHRFPV